MANILSVIFIVLAAAVIFLMFASDNRYGEPMLGDTMLISVTKENSMIKGHVGSLAVVDLSGKKGNGSFASFNGSSVIISDDPMASIGTVSAYLPLLGSVIGFLRKPLGFFLVIVLPLAVLIIFNAVRLSLLVRTQKKGGET